MYNYIHVRPWCNLSIVTSQDCLSPQPTTAAPSTLCASLVDAGQRVTRDHGCGVLMRGLEVKAKEWAGGSGRGRGAWESGGWGGGRRRAWKIDVTRWPICWPGEWNLPTHSASRCPSRASSWRGEAGSGAWDSPWPGGPHHRHWTSAIQRHYTALHYTCCTYLAPCAACHSLHSGSYS